MSIARLASDLTLLGLTQIHDPEIINDPHAREFGATDLVGSGLTLDPARVGATGETVVVAVVSSMYSIIAYRLVFDASDWSAPARTLIEPPSALVPFLPIGGSFDTFGAIGVWAPGVGVHCRRRPPAKVPRRRQHRVGRAVVSCDFVGRFGRNAHHAFHGVKYLARC